MDLNFYKGKKVLLTGHTGFKGSWMSVMLVNLGANVIGFSSCKKKETRLFDLCGIIQFDAPQGRRRIRRRSGGRSRGRLVRYSAGAGDAGRAVL